MRSKQVKVSINTSENIVLEKGVDGEVTTLKRNGITLSEWLIKTEQFSIPSDVQTEINADDKSPKKLQEAKQTRAFWMIGFILAFNSFLKKLLFSLKFILFLK